MFDVNFTPNFDRLAVAAVDHRPAFQLLLNRL